MSDSIPDRERLNETLLQMNSIRSKLITESREGHDVLIYCIDTLLRLINTDELQKAYDFADTVHNMPEICTGERNFSSIAYEIESFRTLYKGEIFPENLFC